VLSECSPASISTTSLLGGLSCESGSARLPLLFVGVFDIRVTRAIMIFTILVIFIVYCVMLAFHTLIVVTAPFELVVVLKLVWARLS